MNVLYACEYVLAGFTAIIICALYARWMHMSSNEFSPLGARMKLKGSSNTISTQIVILLN